jgi:hypothetical protein
MKDFLASLGSLYWWLSVVFVGFLINLFSAYMKSSFDATLSRRSSKRRARAEAEDTTRKKAIANLQGKPDAQILLSEQATRDLIHELEVLVMGVLSIGFRTLLTVMPPDSPTWWPLSPSTVTRFVKIAQFVFGFVFAACMVTVLRVHKAYSYKIRLLADARKENVMY